MAIDDSLDRFIEAQEPVYEQALAEIRAGRKRSHWMWFIFPQIAGLGVSAMAQRYAIQSLSEAEAYLAHPVLGKRLTTGMQALLEVRGRSAYDIFGSPDEMKLRSCATLFSAVSQPGSVFHAVLDHYFDGQPDTQTLDLLQAS